MTDPIAPALPHHLSRRSLFAGTAAGLGAVSVGLGTASSATAGTGSGSHPGPAHHHEGPQPIGPLVTDPAGRLSLPAGFSYTVIAESGVTTLTTGQKTPGRIDGTGAFRVGHRTRLVQNHELKAGDDNPVPAVPGTVYDAGLGDAGGCTVVELDHDGSRASEWVGLSGTISNCAGGVTPWGTWLTCEETETLRAAVPGPGLPAEDHGWVFEVLPAASSRQRPVPIRAWGRFAHEGVVVSPDRRHVYLTEDAGGPNGLLYRWTAPSGTTLRDGSLQRLAPRAGKLQAMRVRIPGGAYLDDLSRLTSADIGRRLEVSWVTVPDRLATTTSTRKQFTEPGAVTRSKKLEGAWGDADGLYFAASYSHGADTPLGAIDHDGQIWHLDEAKQTLTLQAYFPDASVVNTALTLEQLKALPNDVFDGPDNVHVSPYGGLVIAEDGEKVNGLIGWTRSGGAFRLARNEIDLEGANAEMTGPTFSPDGKVLFANVQEPGVAFAITGPFARYLSC